MLTKEDFLEKAYASIPNYPSIEAYFKAKDPRILQNLEAMAAMLSLISAQVEVAQAEPFDKTKDSTVLADAAMRGIIPKSSPTMLNIKVVNTSKVNLTINEGRKLIDTAGRYLRVDTAANIPAGQSAYLIASQLYAISKVHTISESKPFYSIEIDMANDDSKLCGLAVFDGNGNEYLYRERYVNAISGDRIFHIEVDERQRYYIRFGLADLVGVQPNKGDTFTIKAFYSYGKVEYSAGENIAFETNENINEAYLKLSVESVSKVGKDPISTVLIRELAKYPSIYNHNAVYLGEFDSLIRKLYTDIRFLSVWNEAAEEDARGPNLLNINCQFVAVVGPLNEELSYQYITQTTPIEIQPSALTPLQNEIKRTINAADDSYKVRFISPLLRPFKLTVNANISSSYDANVVEKQIRKLLLSTFGQDAMSTRRGRIQLRNQEFHDLLKDNITALSVGTADLKFDIEDLTDFMKPEIWHFLTEETLTTIIKSSNVATGNWGSGF